MHLFLLILLEPRSKLAVLSRIMDKTVIKALNEFEIRFGTGNIIYTQSESLTSKEILDGLLNVITEQCVGESYKLSTSNLS